MNTSRVSPKVLSASILAAMLLAAVVLSACGSSSSTKTASTAKATTTTAASTGSSTSGTSAGPTVPAAGPGGVNIVNYAFGPKTLTVKVGTTVTWKNYDQFDHQVASDSGDPGLAFVLPTQGQNATASHTFTAPGTYGYICNIHNYMKGTIVVTQ
jgi:plastocyanin